MASGLTTRQITRDAPEYQHILEIYHEAFPPEERIPDDLLADFAALGSVHFWAYYDTESRAAGTGEGDPCAFTFCIACERYLYILFLAVNNTMRSRGYGERVLAHLRSSFPAHTHVLEIEPVDEAAPNIDQRHRRLSFYKRNGFTQTGHELYEDGMRYTLLAWEPETPDSMPFEPDAFAEAVRSCMGAALPIEVRPSNSSLRENNH